MKGISSYFIIVGGALFSWMILFNWLGDYIASLLLIEKETFNIQMLIIVLAEAVLSILVGYMVYKLVNIEDNKEVKNKKHHK